MKGRQPASRFRVLGLALVVLAFAAFASPAMAKPFEFHFEREPTQLTGEIDVGEDVFGFDVGLLECTEVGYGGSVAGKNAEVIPLAPTYKACTAFGPVATVDTNGCFYVFKAGEAEGGKFEGSFAIVCAVNPIEVTMSGCTVTIGTQEKLKTVTYANVGAGANRSVTITLNLTGIAYEEHNKGLEPTCTNPGKATKNGTLAATVLVKGEPTKEKGSIGVWVE
jgi:hypothetical protein